MRTLLTLLNIPDHDEALEGQTVVDIGCGDQYIRKPLEQRGALYRGVDVDECDLVSEPLPLPDEACEVAVSLALIEHLADPTNFLVEVQRVLKPGGMLWISTPDIEACREKFWNDPTHVHPYTRRSLAELLEMTGFRNVKVTPNYRCKTENAYKPTRFNFIRARYLLPFDGVTPLPVPEFLKGRCRGLFAIAVK